MDRRTFSILARLELWQLRAFVRIARRDPVFVLAAICLSIAGLAGFRRGAGAIAQADPAVGFMAAIGAGVLVARLLFPRGGTRVRDNLISGPLHELTCEPAPLAAWLLARTLALCLVIDLVLSLTVASRSPIAALVLAPSFAAGALVWSLAEARLVRRGEAAALAGATSVELAPRRRASPRSAWLLLAWLAVGVRRRGMASGPLALVLLVLGGLSAALAAHNNDQPGLAIGLGAVAAIFAAFTVSPDPRLVPVLKREPLSLIRLFAWLYWPSLALAGLGGLCIGLGAGIGVVGGAKIGLSALIAILVITGMLYLHQLTRSPRLALLSLASDLFGAAVLVVIEASLGFLWTGGRGAWLAYRARRMRWLDR